MAYDLCMHSYAYTQAHLHKYTCVIVQIHRHMYIHIVYISTCTFVHMHICFVEGIDQSVLSRSCSFLVAERPSNMQSVLQGLIGLDNRMYCHKETEDEGQKYYFTQSRYTLIGPAGPCPHPRTPGAWQGSHSITSFQVTGDDPRRKAGFVPWSSDLEANLLALDLFTFTILA